MARRLMQKIISYRTQRELLRFAFVEDRAEIICPSPLVADDIRARIPLSRRHKIQTLTIAQLMRGLTERLVPNLDLCQKNDLLLHLAVVWKAKFSPFARRAFPRHFPPHHRLEVFRP